MLQVDTKCIKAEPEGPQSEPEGAQSDPKGSESNPRSSKSDPLATRLQRGGSAAGAKPLDIRRDSHRLPQVYEIFFQNTLTRDSERIPPPARAPLPPAPSSPGAQDFSKNGHENWVAKKMLPKWTSGGTWAAKVSQSVPTWYPN